MSNGYQENTLKVSARNVFKGRITSMIDGAVNAEVGIRLPGGSTVYAVTTNEAALELGLKEGVAATALIKASLIVQGGRPEMRPAPASAIPPAAIRARSGRYGKRN